MKNRQSIDFIMISNKNRDKLHEAAFSSVKAISKNKGLTSSNGLSQRPPIEKNIVIPSPPRSSKDLNKWRGESDFQAFWRPDFK